MRLPILTGISCLALSSVFGDSSVPSLKSPEPIFGGGVMEEGVYLLGGDGFEQPIEGKTVFDVSTLADELLAQMPIRCVQKPQNISVLGG